MHHIISNTLYKGKKRIIAPTRQCFCHFSQKYSKNRSHILLHCRKYFQPFKYSSYVFVHISFFYFVMRTGEPRSEESRHLLKTKQYTVYFSEAMCEEQVKCASRPMYSVFGVPLQRESERVFHSMLPSPYKVLPLSSTCQLDRQKTHIFFVFLML